MAGKAIGTDIQNYEALFEFAELAERGVKELTLGSDGRMKPTDKVFMEVDKEQFKTIFASEKPIFAKFGAPWCSKSQSLEPQLEAIARTYQGKAEFVHLDIDRF